MVSAGLLWGDADRALAQTAASAQVVVTGRVVNAATSRPIGRAVVLAEETGLEATSNPEGAFTLAGLAPGTYHLVVVAPGFLPLRVEVEVGATPGPPLEIELTHELHYSEVVSVSPQARDAFEAYQATSVLAGAELVLELESTLGAALQNQPGIAQRSFGPGPSRPVVRGLDGDRVLIMEDGQRMGDLSSQSGDHGVTTNPAAASRLEVVRGPATLLYGANAIGGLVNVITESVPTQPVKGVSGRALFDAGTAAAEVGAAANLRAGNGRWALDAGGSGRTSGDVNTPEGEVANSQSRGGFGGLGLSWTPEHGFLGASYAYDDTRYGIPYVEDGQVELTPRKHAFSARGEARQLSGGAFASVRGDFGYRSYRHEEIVAGDIGTRFANETFEYNVLAKHQPAGRLEGTVGGWGLRRAFSSEGEEALSPPVDQYGVALFAYEELVWPHATVQFGGRYERAWFRPEGGLPDRDFDNLSGSVGLLVRPTENTSLVASLARAVRNPALEELYFFGPHPGNFAFEIGNPTLAAETALGVDVAFRWRHERVSGEVSFFRNAIDDFVFRQPLSEEEFHDRFGDVAGEEHAGELPYVEFVGADSLLRGFEAHVDLHLTNGLALEAGGDYVWGERRDTGAALPRMPPFRLFAGAHYEWAGWLIGGELTAVAEQDRVYETETPTDGYWLAKFFAAYSFAAGGAAHTVTVRLDNAFNELYRNHLSYIKDFVPEAGRDLKILYSVVF
jgi:iron complex outermembrane receptor protein